MRKKTEEKKRLCLFLDFAQGDQHPQDPTDHQHDDDGIDTDIVDDPVAGHPSDIHGDPCDNDDQGEQGFPVEILQVEHSPSGLMIPFS